MYRTAAKRLFLVTTRFRNNSNARLKFPTPYAFIGSSRFSTSQSEPFSNEQHHNQGPNFPDASSSSSSSTSTSSTWSTSSKVEEAQHHETTRQRATYQDEQDRVLEASLLHVIKLGWTEAALVAGAREASLSPSIIGSFPRKEAALVERAMLVDEIWHATGDNASDVDWYVKRTVLGGIYSATEIYMLTDSSPDFRDTWAFLDARVKDASDLEKTIQEAQYSQAVGAGIGAPCKAL